MRRLLAILFIGASLAAQTPILPPIINPSDTAASVQMMANINAATTARDNLLLAHDAAIRGLKGQNFLVLPLTGLNRIEATGFSGFSGSDVDMAPAKDIDSGVALGPRPKQRIIYTYLFQASGNYMFSARVATPMSGTQFHLEINGINVTGPIAVPNTGGWGVAAASEWTTVAGPTIPLSAGITVITLVADQPYFNVHWLQFVKQ